MMRLLRLALVVGMLLVFTRVATAAPQLAVVTPAPGAVIRGESVTVQVRLSGFELVASAIPLSEAGQQADMNEPGKGMVHLKLDLQPLVILDQGDSYTFNNVPAGPHQLEVELASNDHSLLSPPVVQVVSFNTVAEGAPAGLPATGAGGSSGQPLLWLSLLLLALGGLAHQRIRNGRPG